MLEQMLAAADRCQQEAPLTLKALQTELGTRDQALRAEYDQKLATHVQQLEEKQEREHLLAYFPSAAGRRTRRPCSRSRHSGACIRNWTRCPTSAMACPASVRRRSMIPSRTMTPNMSERSR